MGYSSELDMCEVYGVTFLCIYRFRFWQGREMLELSSGERCVDLKHSRDLIISWVSLLELRPPQSLWTQYVGRGPYTVQLLFIETLSTTN